MIICKVASWHYRCRHNLKNNCNWDNLQCCLLVLRSPSKPVMLTLTCNLEKCYSLRSSFGMYNQERQLWYWHLLTRHCPYICSRSQPLLNMNIERNFEATLWRHRWRHHHKTFFVHNLGWAFYICGQIEAVFNISKFSKWPPFWAWQTF